MTYAVVDIARCLVSWQSCGPRLKHKRASRKTCFLAGYEAAQADLHEKAYKVRQPDERNHMKVGSLD
jgi:hypothetical protein